jgi:C-terminal processing protease CtpA/Prc
VWRKQYAVTRISCTPGPVANQAGPPRRDGTVRFAGEQRSYTVRSYGRRGVLHLEGSVGDQRLRRLPALPDACERPGTTVPTIELEQRVRPFIVRRDLGGRELTTYNNDPIGYADLPGRIGYLRVVLFMWYADGTYEAEVGALDAILTRQRVRSLEGLLVDLRVNGGGSDEFGLRLASRLTGRPYLAYVKRARNDPDDPSRFTTPQPIPVRPADAPRYTGPLVLLTGGSTVSAGETFTQAVMNRTPRPVRIGENTQGVFSDVLERTLPNGFRFIAPNEEYRTRSGRTFDGPGIPPHHRVPVFTEEEFANDRDSAFDLAVSLLR